MDRQGRAAFSNPALILEEPALDSTGHLGSIPDGMRSLELSEVKRKAGMELRFRGLELEISGRAILSNVSGTVGPGELLAVMGPSGSGKTSLLSVLSRRQSVRSGTITVDGTELNKRLRRKMCYVMQQDIFFANLTLKDTLMYQANLKLPSSMKRDVKEKIVTDLVDELDIRKCYNTIIGDDFTRGLSGGERKRANIACELLSDPAVMLLDEPTSGLDSSTAYSLCLTLKRYGEKHHKTVITSIHQPSSQIFHMFDKLLLMSDGEIAYYGAANQILEFFSDLGIHCAPHYNPADFILDKIKQSPEVREKVVTSANALRKTSSECPLEPQYIGSQRADKKMPNGLNVNKHHRLTRPIQSEYNLQSHTQKQGKSQATEDDEDERWASSFCTQYVTLTARNFKQQRAAILSWLNLTQTLIMSLVPGAIFWQLPKVEEQIHATAGLLFFLLVYWGFTPMLQTVSLFPVERPIINKERLSGCYRLSAYYLAKMTSELPLTIVQPAVSMTVTFWMAGLNGPGAYFVDVALVMLEAVAAQSIGLFSSALFLQVNQSLIFSTIFMLVTLLLGGFYVQQLPSWLTWARYLAFISYPFHIMLRMEFSNDRTILCKAQNSAYRHCNAVRSTSNSTAYVPRDEILARYNVTLPIYACVLILLLFLVAFRLACYLVLRFYRKP